MNRNNDNDDGCGGDDDDCCDCIMKVICKKCKTAIDETINQLINPLTHPSFIFSP
jgi:hypothetical protein